MAKQTKQVMKKATLGGALLSPSDFLAAVEFKGKDVTLTIKSISVDDLQTSDGSKRAPVITFHETKKKFVLSAKINIHTIASLYGTAAEDWVDKRITLYPTTCKAFGNPNTDCIRIRPTVPPAKGAKSATAPDPAPAPTEPDTDDQVRRAPSPAAIREAMATEPDEDFLNSVSAANPDLLTR